MSTNWPESLLTNFNGMTAAEAAALNPIDNATAIIVGVWPRKRLMCILLS